MKKRLTLFFVSLFLCVGTALAQTKVTGTVLSQEDGQPIIGAAVKVVGTQTGALTDVNGVFSVSLPNGKKQLEISYLGFESKVVTAKAGMRVFLKTDAKMVDEVIVVAYGTQKKSSFTGSAAVLGSEEIGKVQVTNAVDALKGKAAGVQIYSTSGQPGTTPTIRIRGVNSINADSDPLLVLDGAPYDGSLNDINPADVESMTVLKDAASTSLYGARGGNGVILITTKSGKRGKDATITFDAKWGSNQQATPNYKVVNNPAKYYEKYYSSLNLYAQDKLGYNANEAWQWANQAMIANSGDFTLGYNVYNVPEGQLLIGQNGKLNPNATLGRVVTYAGEQYLLTPDDWEKEVYSNGLRQEYTVSANGATERSTFYLSANYLNNEGITTGSDYISGSKILIVWNGHRITHCPEGHFLRPSGMVTVAANRPHIQGVERIRLQPSELNVSTLCRDHIRNRVWVIVAGAKYILPGNLFGSCRREGYESLVGCCILKRDIHRARTVIRNNLHVINDRSRRIHRIVHVTPAEVETLHRIVVFTPQYVTGCLPIILMRKFTYQNRFLGIDIIEMVCGNQYRSRFPDHCMHICVRGVPVTQPLEPDLVLGGTA